MSTVALVSWSVTAPALPKEYNTQHAFQKIRVKREVQGYTLMAAKLGIPVLKSFN